MRYRRIYRRNGDVIDFRGRNGGGVSERVASKGHEVADYVATGIKQRRSMTASKMAEDLGISVADAERTLSGLASEGYLETTKSVVLGKKIYYAPMTRVSEEERAAQRQRAQQVGAAAYTRAGQVAKFGLGTVVTFRGRRRRYAVAVVEPNYGGEQTYLLVALSGSERGSVPSGVPESDLIKDRDQTLAWSGVEGARLQGKFTGYAGMLGGSVEQRRETHSRAAEMVKAAGAPTVAPGVLLAQRVRSAFPSTRGRWRSVNISIAPGGKAAGVVYVTIGKWSKDSELLEKLMDVLNALNRVGLATHINSVQAYLGRFIITTEPAPPKNAEIVWSELAKVAENAERRGNPRRRR